MKPQARYAVIFRSLLSEREGDTYMDTVMEMVQRAQTMPGFVDVFAMREEGGRQVSISYWESMEAIENWRTDERHRQAKQKGKAIWYDKFQIEICRIESSRDWARAESD